MKAAVFLGANKLEIQDVPIPELGSHDVLIKVAYCGVCGTDVHIYSGDGGAADVTPPLIPGHEFSGIVESVGEMVTRVKVGDRVSVDPNDMCGECYFCKNGQNHFCSNFTGIGTTVNGGFAEYCVVPERQAFHVGDMDLLSAAMIEPLSCCLHGIDLCGICPGDSVLIIGGGPIGLIMLQLAKICGAGKVILSTHSKAKLEQALKLGADIVVNPSEEDLGSIIRENCTNLNVVIECVGNVQTISDSIEYVGKGGTVMMFGLTGPDAELSIKPDVIFKKEIKLTSSFINPYTFGRSIELIKTGRIDVCSSIKNIIPLEELENALSDATLRKDGKVVVKLS